MSEFSELLKRERKAKGLSQAELARKAGLSKNSVYWYENGMVSPNIEAAGKLLESLCVTALIGIGGFAKGFDKDAVMAAWEILESPEEHEEDEVVRAIDIGKMLMAAWLDGEE